MAYLFFRPSKLHLLVESTYINKAHAEGKAIILISHDMDSIFALSARLEVLNFGSVIADGDPAEVKNDPVVIEAYLGKEEEEEKNA